MPLAPDHAACPAHLHLDQQLCFPIYAASNLVARLYRPLLDELGLTYPQYLAMLVLWEASPRTVGALGEQLMLDSGTLTPLLKRMETAGLVHRNRDPADERRVLVSLTDDGQALRVRADSVPHRLACRVLGEGQAGTPAAGHTTDLTLLRTQLQALVRTLSHALVTPTSFYSPPPEHTRHTP